MTDLTSKSDALREMTKGTSEWNKAMSELNQSTIDSVEQFNKLNDTLVTGG